KPVAPEKPEAVVMPAAPRPIIPPAPTAQGRLAPQIDGEAAFWQTVEKSNSPADLEKYLSKYPQGSFADVARNRLAALRVPAAPATTSSLPPVAPPPIGIAAVRASVSRVLPQPAHT